LDGENLFYFCGCLSRRTIEYKPVTLHKRVLKFSSWFVRLFALSELLFNPLNAELNPICHLLALLGTHHILHISRIRVNVNNNVTASHSLLHVVPSFTKRKHSILLPCSVRTIHLTF